jgi:4-diphosphocytidyl-2-C-methyl-D-erythritol kinase
LPGARLPRTVHIRSFAKINLFLDIICRRKDGYHNIETVFQSVDLHDELDLQLLSAGLEISCSDPLAPSDSRNLAAQAFLSLREALGYKQGLRIRIAKKIPIGSGLGGGSSNAAAVLIGVSRLLEVEVPAEKMLHVARKIGADVPFFLSGGLAAGWGIGDRLMPLPKLPESFLVIAVPIGVSVSTPLAYRKLRASQCDTPVPEHFAGCGERLKGFVDAIYPSVALSSNASVLRFLYNELEEPVFRFFPEVADLKKAMLASGADAALMSGSGSAVFGFAQSKGKAEEIYWKLKQAVSCRCFVVSTIDSGSDHEPS